MLAGGIILVQVVLQAVVHATVLSLATVLAILHPKRLVRILFKDLSGTEISPPGGS